MSKFDEVTKKLGEVPYMNPERAEKMRALMHEIGAEQILELGFYHGKSTTYMAAVLEDNDSASGHIVTIDKPWTKNNHPNIDENLAALGLSHRVTALYAHRSHTWELAKMLKQEPRPQFDLCYLDGGHTWDVTGFGFVLADMLIRPGGIIVLDDLNWTVTKSLKHSPQRAKNYETYSQDEKDAQGVRLVWDTIVPHLGYEREEVKALQWGVARKPKRA